MDGVDIFKAILDSLIDEIVFVDAEHIIRYMNPAGKNHYARFGDVIGHSIFLCHNEQSARRIKDIFTQLQAGAEEVLYLDNHEHQVYMRAVRDDVGTLVGYYERYAAPRKSLNREDRR